jgi:hypothetical protein
MAFGQWVNVTARNRNVNSAITKKKKGTVVAMGNGPCLVLSPQHTSGVSINTLKAMKDVIKSRINSAETRSQIITTDLGTVSILISFFLKYKLPCLNPTSPRGGGGLFPELFSNDGRTLASFVVDSLLVRVSSIDDDRLLEVSGSDCLFDVRSKDALLFDDRLIEASGSDCLFDLGSKDLDLFDEA